MYRIGLMSAALLVCLACVAPVYSQQPVAQELSVPLPATATETSANGSAAHQQWSKKDKVPYTGPMQVAELPPTPMLDEEGRQRLDPDGKPMWNSPVKQQRDRYGHPLFDAQGKPVFQTASDLGYDENGKKLHVEKVKPPKLTVMSVKSGVLTVDGLPGKAALNYQIADLKFLYFYAPWIGTAVVSNHPFPGAKEQPNAFNDKSVTITVGEHIFQLTSDDRLLEKKPESAYVLVDRDFKLPTRQPVMGYGDTLRQPYVWPGSKVVQVASKGSVAPPPLPENLRPTQLLPPCPAGEMRRSNRPILPGDVAPTEPCVPIVAATPVAVPEQKPVSAPAAPIQNASSPSTVK